MANEERNQTDPLAEGPLSRVPLDRMSFFSLVRLLERLTSEEARVGEQGPPGAEAIRFRHDPTLIFSARDVSQIEAQRLPRDPSDPLSPHRWVYEITTTFLGVSGSASPLPSYLPEEVAQEDPERPVRRDFLDLFHHRLVSLLYRAVSGYSLWTEQTTDLRDPWSCRLFALLGFDRYESAVELPVKPHLLLHLAPLLAGAPRTARSLGIALEEVLKNSIGEGRVTIHEFAPNWVEIEVPARMRLGTVNSHLGWNATLGRRAFDRSGSFEIEIGPVTWKVYERFLPDGDLRALLKAVTELFLRDPLDYRVTLRMAQREAPQLKLTGTARLGRDSWLGVREGETLVTVA